jgi:hypothetical protein
MLRNVEGSLDENMRVSHFKTDTHDLNVEVLLLAAENKGNLLDS